MPIKALFIANAVMILFVMVVLMQSYHGLNASELLPRMHSQGLIKASS